MLEKAGGGNYSEKFTASLIKLREVSPMEEAGLVLLLYLGEVNQMQPGKTREVTGVITWNFVQ